MRGSANDDLIAETRSLVFDSLFYGKQVQLFKKRFAVFYSPTLKNELGSNEMQGRINPPRTREPLTLKIRKKEEVLPRKALYSFHTDPVTRSVWGVHN